MRARAEGILKNAGIDYSCDVDISGISTLGVRCVAAFCVTPTSTDELVRTVHLLQGASIPYKVVGAMSNIAPSQNEYNGVILNTRKLVGKTVADNVITAECGVRLSDIVRTLSCFSLGGLEPLFHIPGRLGGSVRGNAGAHGLEISDVLTSATVYFPDEDTTVVLGKDEMDFAYRTSILKDNGGILLSARLRALPKSQTQIQADIEHYRALRTNQPHGVRTLGSTFKRVDGVSAGYYIDKCGLKGLRIGDAEVSRVHAGFIINCGNATPDDIVCLINTVKMRVFESFGITLEEEIDYL